MRRDRTLDYGIVGAVIAVAIIVFLRWSGMWPLYDGKATQDAVVEETLAE